MSLESAPVRTRFAPSPTGYLHIGGARTALFCWLFARRHHGTFILRIEDTDRERSTDASIQAILDGMQWLGLDYDEGPFYQTKRFDRYAEVVEQLLAEGKAYRCYCSKARLQELREQQQAAKIKPRYDGCCRDANHPAREGVPFVVRFRNPTEGDVTFDDMVRGPITVSNSELDDLIIARSDGTPTYNFTVVIDDLDMQMTHVIRGDDHINNTPRQINIFRALGAQPPVYGHVPMILGSDGKRLSKRHGAVSVMQYRDDGYLPQALRNYLVRLGWSAGDQEIFSTEEMIQLFSVDAINRAPAAFNHEKLEWLNQHYMKTLEPTEVAEALAWQFTEMGVDFSEGPALEAVVQAQAEKVKTLHEMAQRSRYFYQPVTEYDEKAVAKHMSEGTAADLQAVVACLHALPEWDKSALNQAVRGVAEQRELKLGKLMQPIRIAVTGSTVSPSIDVTLALLGRDQVLARLDQAIQFIKMGVKSA